MKAPAADYPKRLPLTGAIVPLKLLFVLSVGLGPPNIGPLLAKRLPPPPAIGLLLKLVDGLKRLVVGLG